MPIWLKRKGIRKRRKREFWQAQAGLCPICLTVKGYEHFWTFDHIIPRSKGGSNDPSNLRLTCYRCNNKRGNKDVPQNA